MSRSRRFLGWFLLISITLLIGLALFVLWVAHQREVRYRISCCSNLKVIGMGLKMYAGDHKEQYPTSLADVAPYVAEEVKLFTCPATPLTTGAMSEVEIWADYIYVDGLTEVSSPNCVLMFCRPGNHGHAGVNVLFLDGHCEWMSMGELIERLARIQDRCNTGRPPTPRNGGTRYSGKRSESSPGGS